ncbi:ATP-binding cassette domain-containing protein [Scytonema sp. UIC 10036]|uniref:ABC transporter ATP-binding protein n=1 Tax=Scytonema sp. UIC 10036 TaxID=2304196 RepID=UPI0012DA522B|nr:ABC transporter ATP-binding protein [Scytonema sp. UIC 10036]MUG92068.1 ATP-binding cassette domain-containing protein [Scytonema sp. UIC 10036]
MGARSPGKNLKAVLPDGLRIFQRFWPQIRKQKFLIAGSFLALLFETALKLLEPWPLKFIFDSILVTESNTERLGISAAIKGMNPMLLLTLLASAIVAIATLRALATYLSTFGMAMAANFVMAEVRGHLYSHLQRLSLSFHKQFKSGDLITRITYDVERIRSVTIKVALPLVTNLLTLVGMLGIMLWLHWELTLIAVATFPLLVLWSTPLVNRIQVATRRHRKSEGSMANTVAEAMNTIKVVQALSLEEMAEETFSKLNNESLDEGTETEQLRGMLTRTVEILIAIAMAFAIWRGSILILHKTLTPGDLLVFISYYKTALEPMRQIAKQTGLLAKATVSGERLLDVLDMVPEIRDSRGALDAPPFRGAVRFENVSFGYESERVILKNLNFEVQPGQRVALVGPSGSGKSTLVSLLLRLYDPIEGRIFIDGHDLREYKLESLRRQIAIVLQDSVLFAVSVRDNIAYGFLEASQQEIEAVARLANAHDFIMQLPKGYKTILSERGETVSGGQRQRIAIARAAIRNAPIVILDEPTTGLDKENERAVTSALDRLTQEKTTFLISHNPRAVENADLILYIEKGKLLEQGTHAELMRRGGRYAALSQHMSAVGDSIPEAGTHAG